LCAQRSRKLRRSLRSRLLIFKRLLRPLCRAFKTLLTHTRSRPRLLFKDVPSQFLLGNGLSRSAKRSAAHGLRCNLLLLDVTFTSDVG
jgi:hypothetical protein